MTVIQSKMEPSFIMNIRILVFFSLPPTHFNPAVVTTDALPDETFHNFGTIKSVTPRS